MQCTYMLLTYYGSPVCTKYSAINMFISNWKKYKCQGMSEHLKDPKYTLVPMGLIGRMFYTNIAGLKNKDDL